MNNWNDEFFTGYAAAFHHPDLQVLLARYYPQLPFLTAQGTVILEASAMPSWALPNQLFSSSIANA